ncbi:MAG: TetR/AcrR family transcriptional regulator [Alphaproteobacteria bacterium]|nr:TetR/AcrR family transcriptional regulator [Alphaproteobacteria bacterium]
MTEETIANNRHHDRVNLIKERKNHDIRAAAYKLFMAKDYDAITMDEVSLIAKVSKATLYKHFETKEKLYLETMKALFVERETSLESHFDTLDAFLRHYVEISVSKNVTNLMRHCASQMIRFPALAESAWHHYKPILKRVENHLQSNSASQQCSLAGASKQAQVLLALIHSEIIHPVWYGFQPKQAPDVLSNSIKSFMLLSASNSDPHLKIAPQRIEESNKNSQAAINRDQSDLPLRAVYF